MVVVTNECIGSLRGMGLYTGVDGGRGVAHCTRLTWARLAHLSTRPPTSLIDGLGETRSKGK